MSGTCIEKVKKLILAPVSRFISKLIGAMCSYAASQSNSPTFFISLISKITATYMIEQILAKLAYLNLEMSVTRHIGKITKNATMELCIRINLLECTRALSIPNCVKEY